ncbi:hypothetical protein FA10DRAFT_288659 [Acaromyces ingoldii]|uniref:Transmembrane protein n=1 Tax=Acaromyces ingoldii TaxID=215250 RepID=A0A316YFW2_9BASI|nr:hypothetical protein FA10DRAFT_288659 [Acaromyces ingoldii]PWN87966.1 hypothetical protein FA10DRAFT_288659 [Acaromyces ingoldii]
MKRFLKTVGLTVLATVIAILAIGGCVAWNFFLHEQGRAPADYHASARSSDGGVGPLLNRDTVFDVFGKLSIDAGDDDDRVTTLYDGPVFSNATLSKRSLFTRVPVKLPLRKDVLSGEASLVASFYVLPRLPPTHTWRSTHEALAQCTPLAGFAANVKRASSSESDVLTMKDAAGRVTLAKRSRVILSEDTSRYDLAKYRETFGALVEGPAGNNSESKPLEAQSLSMFCGGRASKWLDPFRVYHDFSVGVGTEEEEVALYATKPYVGKYSAGPMDLVRLQDVARAGHDVYAYDWNIKLDVLPPVQLDWATSSDNCSSTAMLRQASLSPNSSTDLVTAQESYEFYAGFTGDAHFPTSKPLASIAYLAFITVVRRIEWPMELLYWCIKRSDTRGLSPLALVLSLCTDVAVLILDWRTTRPSLFAVLLLALRLLALWRARRQRRVVPLRYALAFFTFYFFLARSELALIPASSPSLTIVEDAPLPQALLSAAGTTTTFVLLLANAAQGTFAGTSRWSRLSVTLISLAHLVYAHSEVIGGHKYKHAAYDAASALHLGLGTALVIQGFILYEPV